jgi:outer membrane lipoprotein-sorting protein
MCNRRFLRVAGMGLLTTLAACGGGRSRTPAGPVGAPVPARASARSAGSPRNGLEVIGWMRYAHPSRQLRSLAFTLSTTEYRDDSARVARARVYTALPGKMRLELLPTTRRSGYVRNRHRLSVFERGRRVSTLNRVDLSTLLTYDVFAQSVDTTIMWLDSARVRFGLVHRDELDGRDVWVVGAEEGDTTSAQFWVDAERWHVLRVIQREPRTPSNISDLRFTEYTELLEIPVPTRIQVYRGGRLALQQDISNVAVNPRLQSRAFDLSRWRDVPRN